MDMERIKIANSSFYVQVSVVLLGSLFGLECFPNPMETETTETRSQTSETTSVEVTDLTNESVTPTEGGRDSTGIPSSTSDGSTTTRETSASSNR